jgi:hypothetical protein
MGNSCNNAIFLKEKQMYMKKIVISLFSKAYKLYVKIITERLRNFAHLMMDE